MNLEIKTPRWALPLLEEKNRYYGLRGGRGSGKSHFVAESRIEDLVINPDHKGVCVRQYRTSMKNSSGALLKSKIYAMGVQHLFRITENEIQRIGGEGKIIFMGMQDHNAESIKSLEGMQWCWVEEASKLTAYSLKLLRPTIRNPGSELWFTWNPNKPADAVEKMFMEEKPKNSVCITVNYLDNPFCPQETIDEAEGCREKSLEEYHHIWLGGYLIRSEAVIFKDRVVVRDFTPDHTYGAPLQGLDFGFSNSPTAAVRVYIPDDKKLYISHEFGGTSLDLDKTAKAIEDGATLDNGRGEEKFRPGIPGFCKYRVYADNARPESISLLKKNDIPLISAATKGKGSVEDGIEHMKTYKEIVIHPRCTETQFEFNEYSYEIDKNTEEVSEKIIDKHNHYIDAIRYALWKVIKKGRPTDYAKLM